MPTYLSGYAKTTDIPSLDAYALREEIPNLSQSDLSKYLETMTFDQYRNFNDSRVSSLEQSNSDYQQQLNILKDNQINKLSGKVDIGNRWFMKESNDEQKLCFGYYDNNKNEIDSQCFSTVQAPVPEVISEEIPSPRIQSVVEEIPSPRIQQTRNVVSTTDSLTREPYSFRLAYY